MNCVVVIRVSHIVVQESRSCAVTVTTEQHYISSSSSLNADVSSISSCGSRSHPWQLEATAGQRIQISLLDFTSTATTPLRDHTPSRDHHETCRQHYGYIMEKSSRKNISICSTTGAEGGAKPQREREVYTSETSSLDVVSIAEANTENFNFLIKLQGILLIFIRLK